MGRYRVFYRIGANEALTPAQEYARREAMPFGSYKPDETNTGILQPASELTVYNGSIIMSTANQVVENLDIYGFVDFRNSNQKLKNCIVRGVASPSGGARGIVHARHTDGNPVGAVIEDCTIIPQTPYINHNAITGHDFTAKRVFTRQISDGFGVFNNTNNTTILDGTVNVGIFGCWVQDMAKWYPDINGRSDDGSHNDCVQVQMGKELGDLLIIGNRFHGRISQDAGNTGGLQRDANGNVVNTSVSNAVIQINNDIKLSDNVTYGPGPRGIILEDNWIYGGYIGVNGRDDHLDGMVIRAYRNKFDRTQYFPTQVMSFHSFSNSTYTYDIPTTGANKNVYEDNGATVSPVRFP